MTTVYRTAGAWGAGSGADLTPAQVDTNFYDKETRITAIEAAGVAVGVASITVSGDQMTVHMTDAFNGGTIYIAFRQLDSARRVATTVVVCGERCCL